MKKKILDAIRRNDTERLRLLLENPAVIASLNIDDKEEKELSLQGLPLIIAVERSRIECARMLINAGAIPNQNDRFGRSAMGCVLGSVFDGEYPGAMLRYLISVDYDLEKPCYIRDETILIRAVRCCKDDRTGCFLPMVYTLLNSRANINAQDNEGWTALHWAVFLNMKSIVKLLLYSGADKNIKDTSNKSPKDIAEEENNSLIAQIISEFDEEKCASFIAMQKERYFEDAIALENTLITNGTVLYLTTAGERRMQGFFNRDEPLYSIRAATRDAYDKYVLCNQQDPETRQPLLGTISRLDLPLNPKEILYLDAEDLLEQSSLQATYDKIFQWDSQTGQFTLTKSAFTAKAIESCLHIKVEEIINRGLQPPIINETDFVQNRINNEDDQSDNPSSSPELRFAGP